MLKLIIKKNCPECLSISRKLEELNFAHQIQDIEESNDAEVKNLPEQPAPPFFIDEGNLIAGKEAMIAHLEELKTFKLEWDRFQSDACYCDDEGNVE
ncbi:MAG: hypothetical protein WAN36_04260 [Calditrichia bacterium]